jgi:hypothetical protein
VGHGCSCGYEGRHETKSDAFFARSQLAERRLAIIPSKPHGPSIRERGPHLGVSLDANKRGLAFIQRDPRSALTTTEGRLNRLTPPAAVYSSDLSPHAFPRLLRLNAHTTPNLDLGTVFASVISALRLPPCIFSCWVNQLLNVLNVHPLVYDQDFPERRSRNHILVPSKRFPWPLLCVLCVMAWKSVSESGAMKRIGPEAAGEEEGVWSVSIVTDRPNTRGELVSAPVGCITTITCEVKSAIRNIRSRSSRSQMSLQTAKD